MIKHVHIGIGVKGCRAISRRLRLEQNVFSPPTPKKNKKKKYKILATPLTVTAVVNSKVTVRTNDGLTWWRSSEEKAGQGVRRKEETRRGKRAVDNETIIFLTRVIVVCIYLYVLDHKWVVNLWRHHEVAAAVSRAERVQRRPIVYELGRQTRRAGQYLDVGTVSERLRLPAAQPFRSVIAFSPHVTCREHKQ